MKYVLFGAAVIIAVANVGSAFAIGLGDGGGRSQTVTDETMPRSKTMIGPGDGGGKAATEITTNDDMGYAAKKIKPWISSHCDDPIMNYSRWEGLPVTLCTYTDIGVTVKTYMLNADRDKLAQWVVTGCHDAGVSNVRGCIDHLVGLIEEASSGGIFPIAGYIPEPHKDGGICYVFRDGVTVWTELHPYWVKPKNNKCGTAEEEEMKQPVTKVWKFARVASTTRDEYKKWAGTYPVDGLIWMDAIREEYKKAWNSSRNELISAKAKAAKARGEIR